MPAEKYQSKPSHIVAVQWDGKPETVSDIMLLAQFGDVQFNHATTPPGLIVNTLHGKVAVAIGSWVAKGDADMYPITDEVFKKRWEKVA